MIIDLTTTVSKLHTKKAMENEKMVSFGHLGTHFDIMNKEFPLEYLKRNAIVFNVSKVIDRDIDIEDINLSLIEENMFVSFYSNFIESVEYGSKQYFTDHPQLSNRLIDQLLKKGISIIGIDFAGVRKGKEHTPKDQECADKNVFIVENLCNLNKILKNQSSMCFIAHTYPIKFKGLTGLPCRVVGELYE